MSQSTYYDALGRWAQASSSQVAQLVRLLAPESGNRYTAEPIAFTSSGQTEPPGGPTRTVTNLAEPSDGPGQVPANTDALAIDVGGRWVVFVRQSSSGSGVFAARVIAALGGSGYTVREQSGGSGGTWADAPGALLVAANNLAEMSLGPGAAVDVGTLVMVTGLTDGGTPPTLRYVFDHPVYAKYLD